LWREHRFSTFTVCSCLRSRTMALKYFSYPDLGDEDLEQALALEAEQALQMPSDDIALDWHVNPPEAGVSAGEGRAHAAGFMVAVPRAEVDRHLAILETAGVYPVVLDVACLAVCNLYLTLGGLEPQGGPTGIVHLSPRCADMALLSPDRHLYPSTFFARRSCWNEATDYLAKTIADEIKYYQFRVRRQPVERLILTGNAGVEDASVRPESESGPEPGTEASEESLLGKISKATGLTVTQWDPFRELRVRSRHLQGLMDAEPGFGPMLAVSLGLALRKN
jgi:Tfp pilus assembly PilM family ATPase